MRTLAKSLSQANKYSTKLPEENAMNHPNESLGLSAIESSNPREIRNLLGQFATGVTVITTKGKDGRNIGMTANSFSSVSLDPPLILWSLSKTAPSMPDFMDAEYFAIHVLNQNQHDISGNFAKASDDKFAQVSHKVCERGLPIIDHVLATLVCRNVNQYEGGDHLIFIGQIEHYQFQEGAPLLFHAGKYHVASGHPSYQLTSG